MSTITIYGTGSNGGDLVIGPGGQFQMRNVTAIVNDDGLCQMPAFDWSGNEFTIGKTPVTESMHFAPGPENARTF